nr:EOG090X018J [Eulimnadia texana]
MDVLNKLKSTVSTTVSQLSGVLPGNPVTREYDIIKQIGSAGPGLLWKIYSGHKRSTKQEAAVFVLEKRLLERFSKKDRDYFLELSRKGAAQLTRLRHPQVLTVQHPLEESRESLAFATEPVFSSLANILGNHENLPPATVVSLKDYKLFDVEIKYGLQQIAEGLSFLHNDAKLLHGNICPESVIVNSQGAWKIFGLDFCVIGDSSSDGKVAWNVKELESDITPLAQPNLDFLAPEVSQGKRYGGSTATLPVSHSLDMFSLGCLVYAIFNHGNSPWPMECDIERYFRLSGSNRELPYKGIESVPADLRETVRSLLNSSTEKRIDTYSFLKISYFEDVGVKTLNYLDSLFQWDNLQKSQFFKGLPAVLAKLPHRLCLHRVIPCLAKEFVNPSMVPFVLPCALHIAQEASKEDYVSLILPYLKPVMKLQEPIQILLIFMQKMELLLQKTPADDVKSDVLPMIYRALEVEASPQIQELCLSIIPNFASLIDYPAMKNALIPRIKKLCTGSGLLSVRVNCLLCLGKLLDHLDKWLVLDDVLPMLQKIPSKEPAVIMGILGIYKIAFENPKLGIPKEVLATQIVPFLFPLIVEPGLGLTQFRALMTLLKEMIHRVEEEQKMKLENLAALQEEQKSSLQNTLSGFGDRKQGNVENMSNGKTSNSTTISKPESLDQFFNKMSVQSPTTPSETSRQQPTITPPSSYQNLSLGNQQPTRQPSKPVAQSPLNKSAADSLMNSILESNLTAMKASHPAAPNTLQIAPPPFQSAPLPLPGAQNLKSAPLTPHIAPAPFQSASFTQPIAPYTQQTVSNTSQTAPIPFQSAPYTQPTASHTFPTAPQTFQTAPGTQSWKPLIPSGSSVTQPLIPSAPSRPSTFVTSPLMNQSSSTSVKPLARSDIDDLLS